MKKIAVIGGGPSGLSASYQIKKNHPDYEVFLIEKDAQLGKRIKVSGNGRCNLLNAHISEKDYYHGDLIKSVLNYFSVYQEDFFASLNLHLYQDEEGRVYPITNSSLTVQKAFITALKKNKVTIKYNEKYQSLENKNNKLLLTTNQETYLVDEVIFATGGASYLYSEEDYYQIINSLDSSLKINKLTPILCPLKVKEKVFKEAIGKRSKALVNLFKEDQLIFSEKGEILFKKDGVSGIVIFNASRYITDNKSYTLKINFIPEVKRKTIEDELKHFSKEEVVESYVEESIAKMILTRYKDVYQGLSEFTLEIIGTYSLKDSQVTRGGISLEEVDLTDLSWKKDSRIHFVGEMLDVDGKCGGFNMYFALATGFLVGNKID